jgi:hypothetical protein
MESELPSSLVGCSPVTRALIRFPHWAPQISSAGTQLKDKVFSSAVANVPQTVLAVLLRTGFDLTDGGPNLRRYSSVLVMGTIEHG